ncbi:MAG TPA: fused MFS/spermidine synthase [Candidatus Saccharimonadales bacterium]|nr:fused MFS/spermidine synthase [Candidatus Saccharimonadales bacterium]
MEYARRYYLPVTVCITGACVLVLEIVATRMLAPYFGNTIYTVSSVLSIVLAALSCGYYLGGRMADSRPDKKLFFGIILASGLAVLIMQMSHETLLSLLGRHVSLTVGPLVAGMLLFFAPSFLLGTLSPYAIKLAEMQRQKHGIGSIAGEIFFFSTVGSIFGSLLTGYVLIPHLHISTIVGLAGSVLVVLGAAPLLYVWRADYKRAGLAVLIIAVFVFTACVPQHAGAVVYTTNGVYQQLTIRDHIENGRPVRYLYEDNSLAGAMYLDNDNQLYSKYQDYFVLPEVVQRRTPKHVAILGGGMYIAPKALLKQYADVQVDTVEIEPELPKMAETYFGLPKSPRLAHHVTDGRRFLQDTSTAYDMIYSDVYLSLYATPPHLTTKEFFKTAYAALKPDGLFLANIIDSMDNHNQSVLRAEIQTLRQVFPTVYVFTTRGQTAKGLQNFVVVGSKNKTSFDFTAPQFAQNRYQIVRELAGAQVSFARLGVAGYPVLTDNYAPVENWMTTLDRRLL